MEENNFTKALTQFFTKITNYLYFKEITTISLSTKRLHSFCTSSQKMFTKISFRTENLFLHILTPNTKNLTIYLPSAKEGTKLSLSSLSSPLPSQFDSISILNRIFICGGLTPVHEPLKTTLEFTFPLYNTPSEQISLSQIAEGKIILKQDMLLEKSGESLVSVKQNYVYSLGGELNALYIKQCEKYDIEADKWASFPGFNYAKRCVAANCFQDCEGRISIYAFGGWPAEFVNTLERIQFACEESGWNSVDLEGWAGDCNLASIQVNQKQILVFGGWEFGNLSSKTYLFDCEKNQIQEIEELKQGEQFRRRQPIIFENSVLVMGYDSFALHSFCMKDQQWTILDDKDRWKVIKEDK
jgi:hypothetical protein